MPGSTTTSKPTPAQAASELLRRRRARTSLEAFTLYTKPDYLVSWHHRLICRAMDQFIDGTIKRLMIFIHPRSGKSELTSRRAPAYILGKNPNARIIACSHNIDLASQMNRDVQRIIDSPEYQRLFPGTQLWGKNVRTVASHSYLRNSDIFEVVNHKGSYKSAGVGSGIAGFGFDYGLIDDPLRGAKDARSATIRESQWEWLTSDFRTRQMPDARILITLTRWHWSDICGRLLKLQEEDPSADKWTVIRLPAIAEDTPAHPEDPRAPGEALWPERYGLHYLESARATMGPHPFGALYQQNPTPREGGLFHANSFRTVAAAPAGWDGTRVRFWDKGYSARGDYTVGVRMLRAPDGFYYIEDIVRGRWAPHERNTRIKETAARDAHETGGNVKILIEQPQGAGSETTGNLVRQLAGYAVEAVFPRGSKEERAEPLADQADAGNVYLVLALWNKAFQEEASTFPNGENDDQVDAASGALNYLAARFCGTITESTHQDNRSVVSDAPDGVFVS